MDAVAPLTATADGHQRPCLSDSLTTSTVHSDESVRQGYSSTPGAAVQAQMPW